MRTSKPISTISYNSEEYLKFKLEELRKAKVIEYWAFIFHQREEDEAKDHRHVLIYPAKMLQTMDLETELKEPDFKHPEKPPLGVIPFRSSKFDDWYLYGLHDPAYLASKGLSRKYRYLPSDFLTSDPDYLAELAGTIDWTAFSKYKLIQDAIDQKLTFPRFLQQYSVPIPQVKAYEAVWQLMISERTERRGRSSHTPTSIDPVTGEVVSTSDL